MIALTIKGEPQGKGRPRFRKNGFAYTPLKTRDYEEQIRSEFHKKNSEAVPVYPKGVAVEVYLGIYCGIPKSYSQIKAHRCLIGEILPAKKPDVDNIIKCLDSLNGLAWHDDSQITKVYAAKHYSRDPRLEIRIVEANANVGGLIEEL